MRCTVDEGGHRFRLHGAITEESRFDDILEQLPESFVLDLGEVTRINSSGVRKWLDFVRALGPLRSVDLDRCPVAFVSQLNMIAGMAGAARVRSVFVPLVCPACELTSEDIVAVEAASGDLLSARTCTTCGAELELDVEPSQYFAFTST